MAGPLICDICTEPTDPVVMMVTLTENGDTIALGAGCAPTWAVAAVQALTGIELQLPADDEDTEQPAGEPAEHDDPPAPAPKGRKVREAPSMATGPAAEPEAAPQGA